MTASVTDFYAVLQVPRACNIDANALEHNYRALQSRWHPDKFAGSSDSKRLEAVRQTSLINDAYATLKAPVTRAAHLLQLNGINVEKHDQTQLDPAFLLHQMELRERLEALTSASDSDALDAMQIEVRNASSSQWQQFCRDMDKPDVLSARKVYYKLQFLYKLQEEIRTSQARLLEF